MNRLLIAVAAGASLLVAACGEEPATSATGPGISDKVDDPAIEAEQQSEQQQDLVTDKGTIDRSLDALIGSDIRAADMKARDKYRHPKETLEFFGLEPTMNVVEIWPALGYYMDIVAPYVAGQGLYVAAGFPTDSDSEYVQRIQKAVAEKLAAHPEYYGEIVETVLSEGSYDIAPEASADMVLTFRNVHSWMRGGYAPQVFDAMFKALKPGGVLGLVAHRGNPNVEQDPKAESGYVNQAYVIKMAEDAGFQLVDTSEINANPKDTKDYPKGVWTLPPALRDGDVDREKYLEIGESDRMTLKFMKPATTGMADASDTARGDAPASE